MLSPLTPQQRIDAYKYVRNKISEFVDTSRNGVCDMLLWYCKKVHVSEMITDGVDYRDEMMRKNWFPEFQAQRPPITVGLMWWTQDLTGNTQRIEALNISITKATLASE